MTINKCKWCREVVEVAGFCDPICERLHRVRKARTLPLVLSLDERGIERVPSEVQYNGEGVE